VVSQGALGLACSSVVHLCCKWLHLVNPLGQEKNLQSYMHAIAHCRKTFRCR
jgi:hypothetical protein